MTILRRMIKFGLHLHGDPSQDIPLSYLPNRHSKRSREVEALETPAAIFCRELIDARCVTLGGPSSAKETYYVTAMGLKRGTET